MSPLAKTGRISWSWAFKGVPINITVTGFITIPSFQQQKMYKCQETTKYDIYTGKKLLETLPEEILDTEYTRARL